MNSYHGLHQENTSLFLSPVWPLQAWCSTVLLTEPGSQQRAASPAYAALCCSSADFPVGSSPLTRFLPQSDRAEAGISAWQFLHCLPKTDESLCTAHVCWQLLMEGPWQDWADGTGLWDLEDGPLSDSSPQNLAQAKAQALVLEEFSEYWLSCAFSTHFYSSSKNQRTSTPLGSLPWAPILPVLSLYRSPNQLVYISIPFQKIGTMLDISLNLQVPIWYLA